jgi:nitrous oxidase accessory protein NosD
MSKFLLLLLAAVLASAHAATVRVPAGTSLQQAIRSAKPGMCWRSNARSTPATSWSTSR